MKIALIAFHFKPDEAVGSVRAENWAAWLSDQNEVVVITREARLAQEDEGHRYRIVRPKSAAIRFIDRLNNWRKKRRIQRAAGGPESSTFVPTAPKVVSGAFVYRMPCLHDVWFIACYRALRRERPDVVIATHSPYVSLVVAWVYASSNPKVKLWLDFRDLWYFGHLARGVPFLRGIEHRIEDRVLVRANLVSTVSEGYCKSFRDRMTDDKRVVIYNAPTESIRNIPVKKTDHSAFTICYTGSIYNGWRDPSSLLELFARLTETVGLTPDKARLEVASRMPGDLPSLVTRSGTAEFVDFVGAVSRSEALQMQRNADVLLLLESPAREAEGTVPAKVFEYLAIDRPILLIGPRPKSELYRLLEQHGRLISLERIAAILMGEETIPAQTAVDYSAISRRQLLNALNSLTVR